jgi:hypothetical protein
MGTLVEPTLSDSSGGGGGLYQIPIDTTMFPSGDGYVPIAPNQLQWRHKRGIGFQRTYMGVAWCWPCTCMCYVHCALQVLVSGVGHGGRSGT